MSEFFAGLSDGRLLMAAELILPTAVAATLVRNRYARWEVAAAVALATLLIEQGLALTSAFTVLDSTLERRRQQQWFAEHLVQHLRPVSLGLVPIASAAAWNLLPAKFHSSTPWFTRGAVALTLVAALGGGAILPRLASEHAPGAHLGLILGSMATILAIGGCLRSPPARRPLWVPLAAMATTIGISSVWEPVSTNALLERSYVALLAPASSFPLTIASARVGWWCAFVVAVAHFGAVVGVSRRSRETPVTSVVLAALIVAVTCFGSPLWWPS